MAAPRIQILPTHSEQFVQTFAPEPDAVQEEMTALAEERGDRFPGEASFPTVGHTVGGWLHQLASRPGIDRVFEFGSGFGYSAYWLARALDGSGELVLTERDQDELDLAREFMERGEFRASIRFEQGDARSIFERTTGDFDLVLLDHKNDEYPAAFETVADRLSTGGLLVADNVMTAAIIETEPLLAGLQNGTLSADTNAHTRGVFEFLQAVRTEPRFQTQLLPIGGGVAVSRHGGEIGDE
ncbi:O-methyltransferase [Halodesulfurarchaeum formicicum]|uniref:O-methyltransferase n=1 Tax=Halodesulfurarchaeum formicicum TaxID=1873524 RepID=UPI0008788CD5|nr:class I SAM-dependent methyltransferase [Halodesulfurarchaeum formicicum]